jgi:hypothetical protein
MPLNNSSHWLESVLINVSFVKSSNEEIEMNIGKLGVPFHYTNSFFTFLVFLGSGFKIPYQKVQGIVRELSECFSIVEEIHFTIIRTKLKD